MRKHLLLLLTLAWAGATFAQSSPDSATWLLHKFAQNIGRETYILKYNDTGMVYDVSFKFTDRGSPVPLLARLAVSKTYEPQSLFIKGNTSRFSAINDSVRVQGRTVFIRENDSSYSRELPRISFPVAGYSPGTVQMVLLKYWQTHGKPASIALLPTGTVGIRKDGTEEILFAGKMLKLERYVISGLVWGNELVWTDTHGQLVCLMTNDAEGDKLEMMLEPYEALLPELLRRAGGYGMQLFTAGMPAPKRTPLAIVGGDLVDVTNGEIMQHAVVLVEGGLIKAIGKAGELAVPAGYSVVHAEGKTILPGLWDMHAHFEQAEWGPAYLAAGVTTVRDCGNEIDYINAVQGAIDSGKGLGPHILKAGIVDGPGPMGLGVIRASTPEEARAVVQRYKDNGFVQIKIYSSVTPPIVKAICQEAHRLGLTVTGHIPEGMTLQQGIDSGMDMVNHIQYVYSAMKKGPDRTIDLSDSANQAVLHFIKVHGTVIDPTLGVFEMIFHNVKDDLTGIEPAFASLPMPLQGLFKSMGMPPESAASFKPVLESCGRMVKALHDEGVSIVAGTDMIFPGLSVDRELELYVAGGLSPLEAIQTATLVPAKVMKLDKVTGTIAPGLRADLLIVDGHPLTNIREIRNVMMVIRNGQVYDPKVLRGLAGFGK
jgi:imidazolonepropionase-like amidohydrolase